MKKRIFAIGFGLFVFIFVFVSIFHLFKVNNFNTRRVITSIISKLNNIEIQGSKCQIVIDDNTEYCFTKTLRYYDTDIVFTEPLLIKVPKSKKVLFFNTLTNRQLLQLKNQVYKKALDDSEGLPNKDSENLAKLIITKQYNLNPKSKWQTMDETSQLSRVVNYISYAKVNTVKKEDVASLPTELIKIKEANIIYSAEYDNNITNYYNKNGVVVLRVYKIDNKPYRYQVFDINKEFYTYDFNKKLIEFSETQNIYNAKKEILYTSEGLDQEPLRHENHVTIDNTKLKLIKAINDPDRNEYKSIVKVIDKHYEKGSTDQMVSALQGYFDILRKKNPKLYNKFCDMTKMKSLTIDFGKIDDGKYIFSFSGYCDLDNNSIIASMADTINVFLGRCAEIGLKNLAKDKLAGKYVYDIKLININNRIIVTDHPPCTACNKNISLWGWKYPASK